MDEESKKILIKNSIEKSFSALNSAKKALEYSDSEVCANRVYYAIFYAVLALGYFENFVSSKHKQLMGWFNKMFIYDKNIFPHKMLEIYRNSFSNRQESDYNISEPSSMELVELKKSIEDAEYFINSVIQYLKYEK